MSKIALFLFRESTFLLLIDGVPSGGEECEVLEETERIGKKGAEITEKRDVRETLTSQH